ncbi:MAG TPA: carbohydrate-binding family 9-like protein [Candidatus Aminicenantes bacterium]|nr:carbohydrate-binding family 9-like protein [Candidatus Aminicenantes bacterium]
MRAHFFLAAGLLAAAALSGLAVPPARIPEPKAAFAPCEYVCRRAPGPIRIDGRLDEPAWRDADWAEVFGDIEGPSKPAPRFRTRVQMLWDDDCFYIGAYLEEPHLWATLRERDSIIFQDNDFEVFIDPDGDTHAYYELEMNALNTVWDLLLVKPYRDGGPAVHAWDIQGLRTAVHLMGTLNDPSDRDKAWTAEIALPFAVLRECVPGKPERPVPGEQWRVNFSRVEYRLDVEGGRYVKAVDKASGRPLPEDNWTWSPQGLVNIHYPEMWGFVQFSAKLPGKGKEAFARRPEEKVKWALRRIYYAERRLFDDRGGFVAGLAGLGLEGEPGLRIKGWSYPPEIRVTPSLFEASYTAKTGESWRIRQDGLVWREGPSGAAAK